MTRLTVFSKYFSAGVVASVLLCSRHCVELSDLYCREILLKLDSIQARCAAIQES
jgi:hypothetical protein